MDKFAALRKIAESIDTTDTIVKCLVPVLISVITQIEEREKEVVREQMEQVKSNFMNQLVDHMRRNGFDEDKIAEFKKKHEK